MDQPFSFLIVHHELLSPVQFKLRIILVTNRPETNLEIAGHFVGPRCQYSSTVEVRYPFQTLSEDKPFSLKIPGAQAISRRLVIPEPCQWEPQTPFLYKGFAQLLYQGQELQRWPIRHGLRLMDIFQHGLAWNGKPFFWQGVARRELSGADILGLNKAGVNAILAPVAAADLWEKGDQFGFILIGEVEADERSMVEAFALQNHPCCGAFLFPENTPNLLMANHPLLRSVGILKENKVGLLDSPFPFYVPSPLISPLTFVAGLRLSHPPTNPVPDWVSFVACSEELLPELAPPTLYLPKLLLCHGDVPQTLPGAFGPIVGAISLTR